MKDSRDIHKYAWLEFAIWFFILCIAIVGLRVNHYKKSKELVTYQFFMPDVDGLIVGSPVKFMGVQVGYIKRIKIVSNEVYLKIVITDKNVTLPKGSIATVEFNGMGGSKSLEVYPPNKLSLASNKIIAVQTPIRLHDSMILLSDMFDKIDSIMGRLSFFAQETGALNVQQGVEINGIKDNVHYLDDWMIEHNKKKGQKNGKSQNN